MGKSTDYPLCDLCHTNHPRGGRHSWDKGDEPQTRQSQKPSGGVQDVQTVEGERRADGKPSGGEVQRPPAPDDASLVVGEKSVADKVSILRESLAPKRGRPTNGFDKKEHDRQKSAERRAKIKAHADDPTPR